MQSSSTIETSHPTVGETLHFTSGIPDKGGRRSTAQIQRRLKRDTNNMIVQAKFILLRRTSFIKRILAVTRALKFLLSSRVKATCCLS